MHLAEIRPVMHTASKSDMAFARPTGPSMLPMHSSEILYS